MDSDLKDYQLAYSSEGSDGFSIKLFVRRPAEINKIIDNLDNTSKDGELTHKERANSMFSKVGRDIIDALYKQAVELDPKTPERKAKTKDEFRKAFADAGFDIIFMEAIPNEYWGEDSPESIVDPWYIVTTKIGHIKVGWRKRVISLEWDRSIIQSNSEDIFREEDVTMEKKMIHAYGYEKLTEYLRKLNGASA